MPGQGGRGHEGPGLCAPQDHFRQPGGTTTCPFQFPKSYGKRGDGLKIGGNTSKRSVLLFPAGSLLAGSGREEQGGPGRGRFTKESSWGALIPKVQPPFPALLWQPGAECRNNCPSPRTTEAASALPPHPKAALPRVGVCGCCGVSPSALLHSGNTK